jgi:hypothetical protein
VTTTPLELRNPGNPVEIQRREDIYLFIFPAVFFDFPYNFRIKPWNFKKGRIFCSARI